MLFASMKAAQFTNWTDVLVVIGGSDTETRTHQTSRGSPDNLPGFVSPFAEDRTRFKPQMALMLIMPLSLDLFVKVDNQVGMNMLKLYHQ